MAVDDLYQMRLQCETAGQPWEWGFQYQQVAGTNDAGTLEELAINFNILFNILFAAIIADDSNWQYTDAFPISQNDEIPGSAPSLTDTGLALSPSLPTNMGAKVLWITNAPNSKHNGATAWSGISIAHQSDGILNATYIPLAVSLINALELNIGPIGAGNAEFQPVIVSRFVNGGKRPAPVPFALLEGQLSTRIGNMRRRTTSMRKVLSVPPA